MLATVVSAVKTFVLLTMAPDAPWSADRALPFKFTPLVQQAAGPEA